MKLGPATLIEIIKTKIMCILVLKLNEFTPPQLHGSGYKQMNILHLKYKALATTLR